MTLLSSVACRISIWRPNSFLRWFAYKLNKEMFNRLSVTLGVGWHNAAPPEPVGGIALWWEQWEADLVWHMAAGSSTVWAYLYWWTHRCWCAGGEVDEQWPSCACGVVWQRVTVIEITVESHSRPGVEVPCVGWGTWTLGRCPGLVVTGSSSDLLHVQVTHWKTFLTSLYSSGGVPRWKIA